MTSRRDWRSGARAAAVLAVGVVLGACSSSEPAATATASAAATAAQPKATVAVTLKDFGVAAAPASVAAGQITFAVQNSGAIPHQLVVVKSDLAPDKLPQVNQKLVDVKQVPAVAETQQFDGGKKQEVTATLQPGKYVLFCNVESHYISGMFTAFTVN